jgi:hypothetical protein
MNSGTQIPNIVRPYSIQGMILVDKGPNSSSSPLLIVPQLLLLLWALLIFDTCALIYNQEILLQIVSRDH